MRNIILAVSSLMLLLTGCTQSTRYVSLPGYAHRTDPNCERTQPPSKYDRKCDCPDVGIKGFTPPECPAP